MDFSLRDRRVASGALLGAMLVLAGCQSGNNALEGAGRDTVRESELRAYCPSVQLREGTAYFSTYQGKAKDDPSKLVYQASISEVTRACTYGEGTVTMNVAVAGRIVPGPAGKAGTITMPIRIAVVQGSDVLYSKLHRYPVSVTDTAGATQFFFNDPAVTIPTPSQRNLVIFAGYDEGPYDTP